MTQTPEGRGLRRAVAIAVGAACAIGAGIAIYRLIFAGAHRELVHAGEADRMYWIIGLVAFVIGSAVQSFTFAALERRARRAREAARLPEARAVDRT